MTLEELLYVENKFNLYDYVNSLLQQDISLDMVSSGDKRQLDFEKLCRDIKAILDERDAKEKHEEATLVRQRKALLGFETETNFYKKKIEEILLEQGQMYAYYPPWYNDITEAVFNETIGFSSITNWLTDEKYKDSMSCEIIGGKVFYNIDGKDILQPQKIKKARLDQLINTLLLADPKEVQSKAWHEIYTAVEHLRVTIYKSNGITKNNQETIIFRRYIAKDLTFEEHAKKGTIPEYAIPFFKEMVKLGPNCVWTGGVGTAKTTMMQTYQKLEGERPRQTLSVEADDECQWHKIMPNNFPILQFVPSEKEENTVLARAKRSDAQSIIIGECRSGKYLKLLLDASNMGVRRMKATYHNTLTTDISYDIADSIISECGGDLVATMIKVGRTFNYIWTMATLPEDRGKKRLTGIWEMYFDADDMQIYMHQICKYIPRGNGIPEHWEWDYFISDGLREDFKFENPEVYRNFDSYLKDMSAKHPSTGNTHHKCPYMDVYLKRG